MLRISKWKQWKSCTTTADLLRLMDIHHLCYYIDQRALRWTNTRASGHPTVTQSSTPAPRLSWRASNNKPRDAWLQCSSTWTNLANDRNLWKQATTEYLRLKIYETFLY